jgi:catechol O-methyltransferase
MSDLDDLFGEDVVEEEVSKRPEQSGVMSFHNGTEEAMYHYVKRKCPPGNPLEILKVVDEFCYNEHWMMHIGDKKLQFLQKGLDMVKCNALNGGRSPLNIVELGSYCGYSAIYIANQLDISKGDRLFCIEREEPCCKWTQRMLEYAGLADRVIVINISASETEKLSNALSDSSIDLLFIDHDKAEYLNDLVSMEAAAMFRTGSVVVADNVLSFGVPLTAYLDYVRNPAGPYASSELFEGSVEYSSTEEGGLDAVQNKDFVDGVEISVHK